MAVTGFRHTGIVVSDMDKSLHFYRDLLGLEVWADFRDDSEYVQSVTEEPGANIWMIKLKAPDGASVELLQYLSDPAQVPPPTRSCSVGCNHVAFAVDDIHAMHGKLRSEGIRFHTPPALSPDGGAKATYCRDPEGVIVELVELCDKSS